MSDSRELFMRVIDQTYGEIHGIKEIHVPCSLTYRRYLLFSELKMVSRCSLEIIYSSMWFRPWEVIYFI